MIRTFFFLSITVLFFSCQSTQNVTQINDNPSPPISIPLELENESTLYNPSATRTNDLLHTKLNLKFDWEQQHILGEAWITLKPYFYPTSTVVLDAKGFDIHNVQDGSQNKDLAYQYIDEEKLVIELGRTYAKEEIVSIYINYTAKPEERTISGSAAITSDKGMFFIDPKGEDPNKPTQLWTQGETENNSAWFPTIDKPNEKSTQEIQLTVADKYVTLSNGVKTSSVNNEDGTHTDTWVQKTPHAPYLFMIAVGDYAVVEDSWNDKPLYYYVEPAYEQDAKEIFKYTGEMLSFFSDVLDYPYPWDKYAQVIVRDFVSGAMENTTAVTFQEGFQKTTRELIDETENQRVVAHEAFHHWFGNIVTCESWANLPMNESFANYGEYLWFEHKYGKEEADYHLFGELQGYLSSAKRSMHPLIHFGYENKEDMFDAHSYNKGGCILHMLRNHIGDKAFFASLNHYLTKNEYTDVEAHELRMAIEDVTGKDMNWFFNQWFFDQGHPELSVEESWNEASKKLYITVYQTQEPTINRSVFELPLSIDFYFKDGTSLREEITINSRQQTFDFNLPEQPVWVNLDSKNILVGTIKQDSIAAKLALQYKYAASYRDRLQAIDGLAHNGSINTLATLTTALNDSHWSIRKMALEGLGSDKGDKILSKIREMATTDPHSKVRASAFNILKEVISDKNVELAKKAVQKDASYKVIGSALGLLAEQQPKEALPLIPSLEATKQSDILTAIGNIYLSEGDGSKATFFEENYIHINGVQNFDFLNAYAIISQLKGGEQGNNSYNLLHAIGIDMGQPPYRRYAAVSALDQVRQLFKDKTASTSATDKVVLDKVIMHITDKIEDIKSKETHKQLLRFYSSY